MARRPTSSPRETSPPETAPSPAPSAAGPLAAAERRRDLKEVDAGLSDNLESHRCFSCGHCTRCDPCLVYCPEGIVRRKEHAYAIDYAFCKGFGICVTECPRKAMEMSASCPRNC
jgi:2-oxoacid:acceptor oxidoreductase delta subunit (pyruvate/2-ketoisovalerate family)